MLGHAQHVPDQQLALLRTGEAAKRIESLKRNLGMLLESAWPRSLRSISQGGAHPGLAVEVEVVHPTGTELTRLQVSHDPQHMDNLVDTLAQRGTSRTIREPVTCATRCPQIPTPLAVRRPRKGIHRRCPWACKNGESSRRRVCVC